MKMKYLKKRGTGFITLLCLIIFSADIEFAHSQHVGVDKTPIAINNDLGMKFVLIEPGSMLVGRFEIE